MFGEPYVGGTKSTDDIFQEMVAQRDFLQPHWKWAERVVKVQKQEIVSFEELAEHLLILANYTDVVTAHEHGVIPHEELPVELQQHIEKNNRLIAQVNQARKDVVDILQCEKLGSHAKRIKISKV